jgi:glutamate-1-semialdehyde 2,1-aminomutase
MKLELKPLDIDIFQNELDSFLPEKIFDAHVHLWSEKHIGKCRNESSLRKEVDLEALKKCCSSLLPGREMHFCILGNPLNDYDGHNEWLAEEAAKDHLSKAFMLTIPEMKADEILTKIERSGFAGFKPYRTFAQNTDRSRIADFLPENQMELANEKNLCVTLHLDMLHGISDKRNQKDLNHFTRKYPKIKWILAHCARSFNSRFLEESINFLKGLPNLFYDTSAVCDLYSHLLLLKHEDRKRILYGSDLLAASGIRGKYISYGKAWELYTGKDDLTYCQTGSTYVIYEQLRAQKRAAEIIGITDSELQDIFYNNAINLFRKKDQK